MRWKEEGKRREQLFSFLERGQWMQEAFAPVQGETDICPDKIIVLQELFGNHYYRIIYLHEPQKEYASGK